MSDLSVNNLLSVLQNLQQQQIADAASGEDAAAKPAVANNAGQDLPESPEETAGATATEGSSTPVISSDMTAVLLQMQESQEMTDAQALLYGDTAGNTADGSIPFEGLGAGTSDPTQALLNALSGTSTANLMSTNQTLMDYLSALDTGDTSGTASADASAGNPLGASLSTEA